MSVLLLILFLRVWCPATSLCWSLSSQTSVGVESQECDWSSLYGINCLSVKQPEAQANQTLLNHFWQGTEDSWQLNNYSPDKYIFQLIEGLSLGMSDFRCFCRSSWGRMVGHGGFAIDEKSSFFKTMLLFPLRWCRMQLNRMTASPTTHL